tara:strand:+ start:33689 stop:33988 length:300 start_codon:yes stop_codon:yes gene_type:complete
MTKSTTTAKVTPIKSVTKAPTPSKSLKDIVETTTDKVKSGGLNLDGVLKINPDKTARATHNADRHTALNGKTVREALATRTVDARDLRYDLDKKFMTLS